MTVNHDLAFISQFFGLNEFLFYLKHPLVMAFSQCMAHFPDFKLTLKPYNFCFCIIEFFFD